MVSEGRMQHHSQAAAAGPVPPAARPPCAAVCVPQAIMTGASSPTPPTMWCCLEGWRWCCHACLWGSSTASWCWQQVRCPPALPPKGCKQLFSRDDSHMASLCGAPGTPGWQFGVSSLLAAAVSHPACCALALLPPRSFAAFARGSSHPACCPYMHCCRCAGSILMAIAWPVNLGALGNSLAIWLGISPWQLFFYVFLPPLLLDAAVRIDWYLFKKVCAVLCCAADAG